MAGADPTSLGNTLGQMARAVHTATGGRSAILPILKPINN